MGSRLKINRALVVLCCTWKEGKRWSGLLKIKCRFTRMGHSSSPLND